MAYLKFIILATIALVAWTSSCQFKPNPHNQHSHKQRCRQCKPEKGHPHDYCPEDSSHGHGGHGHSGHGHSGHRHGGHSSGHGGYTNEEVDCPCANDPHCQTDTCVQIIDQLNPLELSVYLPLLCCTEVLDLDKTGQKTQTNKPCFDLVWDPLQCCNSTDDAKYQRCLRTPPRLELQLKDCYLNITVKNIDELPLLKCVGLAVCKVGTAVGKLLKDVKLL